MCMSVLPACMFVYNIDVWCQRRSEKDIKEGVDVIKIHCTHVRNFQIIKNILKTNK